MLKSVCEKGTKFVSRCCWILPEDFRALGGSFDKSRKLMIFNKILISHDIINCYLNIYAEFYNR